MLMKSSSPFSIKILSWRLSIKRPCNEYHIASVYLHSDFIQFYTTCRKCVKKL